MVFLPLSSRKGVISFMFIYHPPHTCPMSCLYLYVLNRFALFCVYRSSIPEAQVVKLLPCRGHGLFITFDTIDVDSDARSQAINIQIIDSVLPEYSVPRATRVKLLISDREFQKYTPPRKCIVSQGETRSGTRLYKAHVKNYHWLSIQSTF